MPDKTHRGLSAWEVRLLWVLFFHAGIAALYLSKSILIPLLVALLLAYAFDPLVDRFEAKGLPRPLTIGFIFFATMIVLFLILFFFIPILQDQMTKTFDQLPIYLTQLYNDVLPALGKRVGLQFPKTFDETINSVLQKLTNGAPDLFKPVGTFMLGFFNNTLGVIITIANLVIIPFMFYYLLKDFDRIKTHLSAYIPLRYRDEVFKRFSEIDLSLSGFIRGQLLVVLFLAVIYVVGLTWIGLDLSFVLGVIAAAGEVVPYVGFAFGLGLSLLFAFLQFQDLLHLLYVVLLFGGIQAIQGVVIAPWVMGKQVGLHPLVIVTAIYVGGDFFGFVGILLAVPGAAIFVVLLRALGEYYQNSSLFHGPSE